jgi:hypothetical protein
MRRLTTMLTTTIPQVRFRTVDEVRIRYADTGGSEELAVLLTSPWPESLFAFAPIWNMVAKFPAAGHVLVKDRVNAIALAPVADFRRDSDLFGEGVRNRDAQRLIAAALRHGFQTRDAELALGRMLGELTDH